MEESNAATGKAPKAVVIQTLWRTGGTYLSFMLRERDPIAQFYEPLHESYSNHTSEFWDALAQSGADEAMKHPKKSDFHYMTDLPFVPDGAVAGQSPAFAYDRFVLSEDEYAPALKDYLLGLTAHAASLGQRPMFKFCRGFLRRRRLQKVLDPVTVYLARRVGGMCASYDRMGEGHHYSGFLAILHRNRDLPALASIYAYLTWMNANYASASVQMLAGRRTADLFPIDVLTTWSCFFGRWRWR